ncbi:epsin amino-terminal-like (ENTH) domain protein [Ceratobasidium sp. AG-Ba]|nr:epsin amino-terminal-like (ENTH) domain protein [Ceratobasidium sp. AG-Ba]
MSMQHFGKGALRVAKNYTKGYSDVQAKVRDATSNDPWGPSGTQMNDIAQMTYNQNDFVEIMEMLDKRLNDKGKNWRHVFKALTVLDYCLHAGSENTVIYFKDNLYVIKTLKEFQFVDEYGKDQGANVRQKAKDITNLLMDDARLREERRSRASMRDRMVRGGTGEFGQDDDPMENENERRRRAQQMLGPSRGNPSREDDEMRRAIEASKRSLADEKRRQGEEQDLAKALALSEADEAARKRALQDSGGLFDNQAENAAPANPGGDLLIDFNAAPQQQLQPQFTSFNPYLQQTQQQAMQEQYLRQQAEWEAMQQAQLQAQQQAQQEEWMRQQMAQQQQAQQDEWNRQQQLLMQQQQQQQYLMAQQQMHSPLMAQPTGYGSNNPFAMMGGQVQPQQQLSPAPAPAMSPMPSISERPAASPSPSLNSLTQQNTVANSRRTPANDGANAHLAHLIANREDGQDTFGNVGSLRFGHGNTAQRLHQQQTGVGGHNPFGQQQTQQSEQPFFTV